MTDVLHGRGPSPKSAGPTAAPVSSGRVAQVPEPIRMVDVVRELQAIALAAQRSHHPEIVEACRRVQSLLARPRNDFVEDLIGDKAPSERAA